MIRALAVAALVALPATAQDVPPPVAGLVADLTAQAIPLSPDGDPSTEIWMGTDARSLAVRNVSQPALISVLPDPARATGAGVVVVPGGGLVLLSMGNEGMDVARALADRGIAAFVVKYRTDPTPADPAAMAEHVQAGVAAFLATGSTGPLAGEGPAQEDVVAALRHVTGRASDYGVDPARLGLIGFSAGAITALNVVLDDQAGARPAFAGIIYGRMNAVTSPADALPLFVALAADDPLFGQTGFGLPDSWRATGHPVEFHDYDRGGHGFGIAPQGAPSDAWFDAFLTWLAARGVL